MEWETKPIWFYYSLTRTCTRGRIFGSHKVYGVLRNGIYPREQYYVGPKDNPIKEIYT